MKKSAYIFLAGAAVIFSTAPAFAKHLENGEDSTSHAVSITLGSSGGALDNAALRSVRKLVGKAISAEIVDTFAVYSPGLAALSRSRVA